MSRTLLIKGIFKNGKARNIGIHNSKNSELKISLFSNDDINHLVRMTEYDKKCFNWCIENNKFKKIEVIFNCSNSVGKHINTIEEIQVNKRIDKNLIIELVNKYNFVDTL